MRYSSTVRLPKAVAMRRDDVMALLSVASSHLGAGANFAWTISSPLNTIEGRSLEELAETLSRLTYDPSGLRASAYRDEDWATASSLGSRAITLDATGNDPRFEVVAVDGEWVARAVRELRAEIAERALRSPIVWRRWYVPTAIGLGVATMLAGFATGGAAGPDGRYSIPSYGIALIVGSVALIVGSSALRRGTGEARLAMRGQQQNWYDRPFVRGMVTGGALLGLAWTLYQLISAFLRVV